MISDFSRAKEYDVVIIGGGPAGYHAALELAAGKKHVLIIEKNEVGGVCLHKGCIPTKSLLFSSKEFYLGRGKQGLSFDTEKAIQKEKKDIRTLLQSLKSRLKQNGVDCVNGKAEIESQVKGGFLISAGEDKFFATDLVIAAGSSQNEISISGLGQNDREPYVFNSDDFFSLSSYEDRIAIVGGGVVGIEFATFLNQIGRKVTVFEKKEELLEGILDPDVGNFVKNSFTKKGIDFVLGCEIQEVRDHTILYEKDGVLEEAEAGQILVTGGRLCNVRNLGLSKVGLNEEDSRILVDEYCETGTSHVYACGDVTGNCMLAHAAYREAEIVAANILGKKQKMSYAAIPSVIYSNPEIAMAGVREEECKLSGKEVVTKCLPMVYSSRYFIENETQKENGICKLIFDKEKTLIGAQLAGNGVSELIFSVAEMIRQRMTAESIKNMIFPHPSIAEIVKETILWGR